MTKIALTTIIKIKINNKNPLKHSLDFIYEILALAIRGGQFGHPNPTKSNPIQETRICLDLNLYKTPFRSNNKY